jgi:nitrile hydratase
VNGVHDMGGMQDMGPIVREDVAPRNPAGAGMPARADAEPTFHAEWEARVYAMMRVLRTQRGPWNLDASRSGVESLPPIDYLRMSYYERWFTWMRRTLVASGNATQDEIDSGLPAPGSTRRPAPLVTADAADAMALLRASARRDVPAIARFERGDLVCARNIHPTHHTRLPRYVRGKCGEVLADRGVFVFPDTNAHQQGEQPQHLYSVRFTARELWGEQAAPRDTVHLDLWDSYLERA